MNAYQKELKKKNMITNWTMSILVSLIFIPWGYVSIVSGIEIFSQPEQVEGLIAIPDAIAYIIKKLS